MRSNQIAQMIKDLPLAQRIVAASGLVVLALAGVVFYQWVSTPTYSILYSGLDDQTLNEVITGLESQGVDYKLEAAGSQVLVPQADVYRARAALAADGVTGDGSRAGYELLDEQGLGVSEFKQAIDYQRALEGELARTLLAMDAITSATVHLVLPEEALFAQNQESATASVVIDSSRALRVDEIETVAFVVASAVEGLEADAVTVAHVDGRILHAPGDGGIAGAVGNRNLRMVEAFEDSLAGDVEALLSSVMGDGRASVVVRAELNFDEQTVETESYDPATATPVREQLLDERLEGAGAVPVGTVGVNGEEIVPNADGTYVYERNESTTEYGVNRVTSLAVTAPGKVEKLSVAVLMDDGSLTGAVTPSTEEITALVSAAMGLDPARGDTVQVTAAAFPAVEDATSVDPTAVEASAMTSQIPQFAGAAAVVLVVIALLFMTRTGKAGGRRRGNKGEDDATGAYPAGMTPGGLPAGMVAQALPTGGGTPRAPLVAGGTGSANLEQSVRSLAESQPEEVAALVSDWLKEGASA